MRRALFLLGVFLHASILIGWAASLERARAAATMIRLEVVQRDPRDLLSGDYIRLSYKASEIPSSTFMSLAGADPGLRVYVALAPRDGLYEVAAASLSREVLPLPPRHRLLVGRIEYVGSGGKIVHVAYGIERFYVPEGKGTSPRGKIEAEVALTADGRPFLTRLFVDGRPYP